jgi:hypothetical protein
LIPLLPRRVGSNVPSHPTLPGVGTVTRSPLMTYLIFYVIFTLFMLGCCWLVASPQAPAQPTVNDRPKQEKAGQAEAQREDQQLQPSQASAAIWSAP